MIMFNVAPTRNQLGFWKPEASPIRVCFVTCYRLIDLLRIEVMAYMVRCVLFALFGNVKDIGLQRNPFKEPKTLF